MKKLLEIWKAVRGYKRQAGAIIALLPIIAGQFGIDIPKEWLEAITTAGTLIWGIGWADRGAVEITKKLTEGKKA